MVLAALIVVILAIAAAVLTFAVVNTVGGTEGAEGVASDVASGTGESLDNVSNEEMEAVVAANPDISPMRLALAVRYFAVGEFSDALTAVVTASTVYEEEEMATGGNGKDRRPDSPEQA